MQKFDLKLKNTPKDAPQVLCSVNSSLNKDQSLSVKNKVLELNNKLEKIVNKSIKKIDWVFHNKTLIWEKIIHLF